MKKKKILASWALFLSSIFLFVYDLVNSTNSSKFQILDFQLLEACIMILFLIVSFENYHKTIHNSKVHLVSFFVSYYLIGTIKYELDSYFFSVIHSICYVYLFVILVITTKKIKDNAVII